MSRRILRLAAVGLVLCALPRGLAAQYDECRPGSGSNEAKTLALFSVLMWLIYAATLLGRVVGHWRGRRAAYLSIAGFCVMLVTLSAGALLHGHLAS